MRLDMEKSTVTDAISSETFKTGQMDSGIHIYCYDIYAENSTHNFYRKTGPKLPVQEFWSIPSSFCCQLQVIDKKRYFLSMIETNYQKSPIRVSSIILKAHLWPLPSSRSVLLSFPQLGASIPHLKIKISDKRFENDPPSPAIAE